MTTGPYSVTTDTDDTVGFRVAGPNLYLWFAARSEADDERDRLNAAYAAGAASREKSDESYQLGFIAGSESRDAEVAALVAQAEAGKRLAEECDCACNALTDSILVSGNDARTNLGRVKRLAHALAAYRKDVEAAR